jgi:AraC family transcriptional regulator, positive regulator of tynA and feaB
MVWLGVSSHLQGGCFVNVDLLPHRALLHAWSTDVVPAKERMDYWVGAVCEGFLEMAVTSPEAATFHSRLTTASIGPLTTSLVSGSAADVARTRQAIARGSENYFYLMCQQQGDWSVAQSGQRATLSAGDMAIVDSRHCYEFHFPVCANVLSIGLPIAWMERWIPKPQAHVARAISASEGWGRALGAFAQQLTPERAIETALPAELITDQLGGLLALVLGAAEAPSHFCSNLYLRIKSAVAERYAEYGLTVAHVAAGLNISERTLHRTLSHSGDTFGNLLVSARMLAAQRMLASPRFDRLAISEIGHRVGFSDSSHFARQCRRSLGATPNALRQNRR